MAVAIENKDGIFGTYPFLLPCLVSGLLNFVGLILGYFFLRETVAIAPKSVEASQHQPQLAQSAGDDIVEIDLPELAASQKKPAESNVDVREMEFFAGLVYTGKQFGQALKDQAVLVTMLLYAVHAAVWLCFDEVFAIWALQEVRLGGLAFQEKSIGIAHAISGVGMIVLQLFAYPALDKAVGSRRAFQITAGALGPVCVLMPFTNLLASGSTALLWICVGTLMAMKSAMGTGGMAGVNLMISNASDPKSVGSINGLSASIAALSRLIAPTFGGSVYAWSLNNGMPFPFDFHLVFLLLGMICGGMVWASQVFLDKSIDVRRKPK